MRLFMSHVLTHSAILLSIDFKSCNGAALLTSNNDIDIDRKFNWSQRFSHAKKDTNGWWLYHPTQNARNPPVINNNNYFRTSNAKKYEQPYYAAEIESDSTDDDDNSNNIDSYIDHVTIDPDDPCYEQPSSSSSWLPDRLYYDNSGGPPKPQRCIPNFVNVAYGVNISASSTCGQTGGAEHLCFARSQDTQDLYHKTNSAHDDGSWCELCSSNNNAHSSEFLTDLNNPNNVTYWASQPFPRHRPLIAGEDDDDDLEYENDNVTLHLALGKRYEVTYITLQFFANAMPESLIILKSNDYGHTWQPFQYYSTECKSFYGIESIDDLNSQRASLFDGGGRQDGYGSGGGNQSAFCIDHMKQLRRNSPSSHSAHQSSVLNGQRNHRIAFSTLDKRPLLYSGYEDDVEMLMWTMATDIKIVFQRPLIESSNKDEDDEIDWDDDDEVNNVDVFQNSRNNYFMRRNRRHVRPPASASDADAVWQESASAKLLQLKKNLLAVDEEDSSDDNDESLTSGSKVLEILLSNGTVREEFPKLTTITESVKFQKAEAVNDSAVFEDDNLIVNDPLLSESVQSTPINDQTTTSKSAEFNEPVDVDDSNNQSSDFDIFEQTTTVATTTTTTSKPNIRSGPFYAISDLAVGGRCYCNGHASKCERNPHTGQQQCMCRHNTEGVDCERCKKFFMDKPWARATSKNAHECTECNCNNRARRCAFNEELWKLSGRTSGGVCLGCQYNTAGRYCHLCRQGYYRDLSVSLQDRRACKPCYCHPMGTMSKTCNSTSVQCTCKAGVTGVACNKCEPGYRPTRLAIAPCVRNLVHDDHRTNYGSRRYFETYNKHRIYGGASFNKTDDTSLYRRVQQRDCGKCKITGRKPSTKRFCNRSYAAQILILGRSNHDQFAPSSSWTRLDVEVQFVWKRRRISGPTLGLTHVWLPTSAAACGCPLLKPGQRYIVVLGTASPDDNNNRNMNDVHLSQFSKPHTQQQQKIVIDKNALVVPWSQKMSARFSKFQRRAMLGKCNNW